MKKWCGKWMILSMLMLLLGSGITAAASDFGNTESTQVAGKTGEVTTEDKKITTALFIGVDNENNRQEEGSDASADTESGSGMADSLFLVVMNEEKGKTTIVGINRDTMADVDIYDASGEYFRTSRLQIALSHAYGDGQEESCENTVKAVSKLFGGIDIDYYAALKMAAIPELNDAVGGVQVEVLEDMTALNPEFWEGNTVVLEGDMALQYVRWRNTEDLNSSNLRLQRQKQYVSAFSDKLVETVSADLGSLLDMKEEIERYMVTNCTDEELLTLFNSFRNCTDEDFCTVPGSIQQGKVYAEFIADEQGLQELREELWGSDPTE